jgi:mono/diheme cytochrome c family protein
MSRCVSDVARPITRLERSESDSRATLIRTCAFTRCLLRITSASTGEEGGEMNENSPAPERRVRQGMDYGETEDVQKVHAAIQREKREPAVGLEPLSLWLIAIYGLAIFFGGAYLGRYSGNFSGDGLDPLGGAPRTTKTGPHSQNEGPIVMTSAERGKKIFSANCATCHQMSGTGVAGQYPPLAGSEYVNGGTRRLGMIVLKGLQGPLVVKGVTFGSAVMQPWEKTLTDAKIADVLSFIRQEWGNKGGLVAPEGIAALRKELASHPDSFTEPDLKAVPEDANLPGGESPATKPGEPPNP